MRHVAAVDPDLPIPAVVPATDGADVVTILDDEGRECLARLITVVPGTPLEGHVVTEDLAEQVGAATARTARALRGFFHPAGGSRSLDWEVRALPSVAAAAGLAPDDPLREVVAPGHRGPAGAGRTARRHPPRRRHPDQPARHGRQGHRGHRLRRHAPHRRRGGPRGRPHVGAAQHQRHPGLLAVGARRRDAPRLPAAAPADPRRGRGARRAGALTPRVEHDHLPPARGDPSRQHGVHHAVRRRQRPDDDRAAAAVADRAGPAAPPPRGDGRGDDRHQRGAATPTRGRDGRHGRAAVLRPAPADRPRRGAVARRRRRPHVPRCLQQRRRRRATPTRPSSGGSVDSWAGSTPTRATSTRRSSSSPSGWWRRCRPGSTRSSSRRRGPRPTSWPGGWPPRRPAARARWSSRTPTTARRGGWPTSAPASGRRDTGPMPSAPSARPSTRATSAPRAPPTRWARPPASSPHSATGPRCCSPTPASPAKACTTPPRRTSRDCSPAHTPRVRCTSPTKCRSATAAPGPASGGSRSRASCPTW